MSFRTLSRRCLSSTSPLLHASSALRPPHFSRTFFNSTNNASIATGRRQSIALYLFSGLAAGVLASYLSTTPPHLCDATSLPPSQRDALEKSSTGITASSPMRLKMESLIRAKQKEIVAALEEVDGHPFQIDVWTRPHGGGGVSCVLQNGTVFEKAGVNISVVYGQLPPAAVRSMRVNHKSISPTEDALDFFAAGLSMVLHPVNPMAPTVHLNYRYFETMMADGATKSWWFGGGTDLTPSYLFEEDCEHFHRTLKEACDKHDSGYYPRFKKWCDDYFFVKHRGESRGVGGIFFDDLDDKNPEDLLSFVTDCLDSFLPAYLPIIEKRKNMPYTDAEKQWQQLRRGRYVEFNLVHDRGTAFGLNTPGSRVESILMSLPLTAQWQYMHKPESGSREEKLLGVLMNPVEWVEVVEVVVPDEEGKEGDEEGVKADGKTEK